MKYIFLIRHCEAEGQAPEARLTRKGVQQAFHLQRFFSEIEIDRIITSPFQRAIQTIEPLAKQKAVKIEINEQLKERVLSTIDYIDWFDKLKATYDDRSLKFEGGESTEEAMTRVRKVLDDLLESESNNIIIVSHGNLLSLLLKSMNHNYGFQDWQMLSNPDVYQIQFERGSLSYVRIWK